MQKDNVRWAILGAGRIAHKFAQDFKAVKNAALVAVAASDKSRSAAFAAQYNIPRAFDYEELYSSNEVDAVYIATTHNFHYEQSLACMQIGKAVLCEKPVTINDAQFKKLAALSKEKSVFFMEALWTYFLPAIQTAKRWIEETKIGTLKAIKADFSFPMEYNPSGRLFNPWLAGGALLDLGIYPIAFATYFMNRTPDVVKASAVMGSTGVDEAPVLFFQYENVPAVLFCSMAMKTLNKGYIIGERGFIEILDFYKAATAKLYNADQQLLESFDDKRTTFGYEFEIQEATDAILQGKIESNIVPHQRSNELQELMTEIRRQIGLRYPMEDEAQP